MKIIKIEEGISIEIELKNKTFRIIDDEFGGIRIIKKDLKSISEGIIVQPVVSNVIIVS